MGIEQETIKEIARTILEKKKLEVEIGRKFFELKDAGNEIIVLDKDKFEKWKKEHGEGSEETQ